MRGWPEAPSSPLQGGGAGGPPSGPGAACAVGPDFGPEKMLPKKLETPLPEDWAWDGLTKMAWLEHTSAAAIMIAPARLVIARSGKPIQCPSVASHPGSEGPATVSNNLTEAEFRCRPRPAQGEAKQLAPYIRLCWGMQTGYQRAIKALSPFPKFLISKALDIP